MGRPTQIIIDLPALKHNVKKIKQLAPNSAILAMVKSNAYGHGLERIALALSDIDALGVACIEEGLLLRKAGVVAPIVLMEGLFTGDELTVAAAQEFSLVVHHQAQIELFESYSDTRPSFNVWLKLNTGMNRLGFDVGEILSAYQRLFDCSNIKKPIGLMTHFAQADSVERAFTREQMNCFNAATQGLTGPRSLSNSAGIIAWPTAHADWVRPGIMLYGVSPFKGHCGLEHDLKPVMSLTSRIIAIQSVAKGQSIGYGGDWVCPEDMRVGVVAMGYGDGYPQYARHGTPVLVNGRHCPLVGRVSMDMLTVDLRTQPEAQVGDLVTLWGPGLPVEVVAERNETSGYELLTRITQRVRVIVES